MFSEDRVKISTKIYIDDELVDVNQEKIKISGDGIGKKSISTDGEYLKISFKGNKYSNYDIDLYADDYRIKIVLHHWNWWDINRINTKENTISYFITNNFISEGKEYTEDEVVISDTKELSEINKIVIE